jgi:hypothetical protein
MSDVHQPPRLAETLLSKVVGSDDREAIMGDLAEEYGLRREASGVAAADRWYWRQTVLTLVQGRIRRPLRALLLTVVILPAWWLLLREVFQFLDRNGVGNWRTHEASIVASLLLATMVTMRLRLRVASYFFGGLSAWQLAEHAIHSIYGNHWLQQAPNHFGAMAAAFFGLLFGALIRGTLTQKPAARAGGEPTADGLTADG